MKRFQDIFLRFISALLCYRKYVDTKIYSICEIDVNSGDSLNFSIERTCVHPMHRAERICQTELFLFFLYESHRSCLQCKSGSKKKSLILFQSIDFSSSITIDSVVLGVIQITHGARIFYETKLTSDGEFIERGNRTEIFMSKSIEISNDGCTIN